MATPTKAPAKRAAKKAPAKKAPAKRAPRKVTVYRPPPEIADAEILGVTELPAFLGFKRSTVHVWGHRQQLPPEDLQVNGHSAWYRATILRWAAETGRLPEYLRAEGAQYEPEGGYRRKRRTKAEIAAANGSR